MNQTLGNQRDLGGPCLERTPGRIWQLSGLLFMGLLLTYFSGYSQTACPGVPSASDVEICSGNSAVITAQMGEPAGTTLRLYNAPIGGSQLSSSTGPIFRVSTPVLQQSSLFWIAAANANCESSRIPVNVQVGPINPGFPGVDKTAVRRCANGAVQFTVTNPNGHDIRLYDSPAGGNIVNRSSSFTALLNTPAISGNTRYWIAANRQGCEGPRVEVLAEVLPVPDAPTASDLELCAGNTAVFTANMGTVAGTAIRLYNAEVGGTLLSESMGPDYLLSTPVLNQPGAFWLASVQGGCESVRTRVFAQVGTENPGLPDVVRSNVARCQEGQVQFTVNNPEGDEIRLFTDAVGGQQLDVTMEDPAVLNTPFIGTTSVYWIAANRDGCEGPRQVVTATITELPPDGPSVPNVARCGAGDLVITASMGLRPGSEMRLYSEQDDQSPMMVDSFFPYIFPLNNAQDSKIYWVASASNGCESTRIPVRAEVYPQPNNPSAAQVTRCYRGRLTFTAEMGMPIPGSELRLYASMQDQMPVTVDATAPYNLATPVIDATTTFYLASGNAFCESARIPVVARVLNTQLAQPSVVDRHLQRCEAGTLAFSVQMVTPAGEELRLYDQQFGGTLISSRRGTHGLLATSEISTTTTFWIASGAGTCESRRVPVTAQVATYLPEAPTADNTTLERCGIGTLTFSGVPAVDPNSVILRLYDAPVGGNLLDRDDAAPYLLTTGYLTTDTDFWIASADTTGICESPRTRLTAIVGTTVPTPPMIDQFNLDRCGPGTAIFTVRNTTQPADEFRLYDMGMNLLDTNDDNPGTLTTPELTATQDFYIVGANGPCESFKQRVTVDFIPGPDRPDVADVARCGGGAVTITALAGPAPIMEMRLYPSRDASTPVTADRSAPYELTFPTQSSTRWFVAAASSTCESDRVPVDVTINPTPAGAPTISSNAPICSGSTLELTGSDVAGATGYLWTGPNGFQAPIQNGALANVAVSDGGLYSLVAINGNCTSAVSTSNIVILESPQLELIKTDVPNQPQGFGSINARATGGVPIYRYTLGNTTLASNVDVTFRRLNAGTYDVTVQDAQGCRASASINLQNVACALSATAEIRDVLCKGGSDGLIDATITGGTQPYTFNWSNGATTEDLVDVPAGSYTGRISDRNGCTQVVTLEVGEPAQALDLSVDGSGTSCSTCQDGRIFVNATGGTAPYRYGLNGGNYQSNNVFTNLNAGSYQVTVLDANNCMAATTFNVPDRDAQTCSEAPAVSLEEVSTRSARISWPFAAGAYQYQVSYRLVGETTYRNLFTTQNTLTLNDLIPFETYEVRVRNYCTLGDISAYSETVTFSTNDFSTCQVPGRPFLTEIGSNSAQVIWESGTPGVFNYELQYQQAGAASWNRVTTGNNNSLLVNLTGNTEYTLRLRRVCDNGQSSDFTQEVNFRTAPVITCNAPGTPIISNIQENRAQVSWSNGNGGSLSFELQYRQIGTSNWTTRAVVGNTSHQLENLMSGMEYEVRVRRQCDALTYSLYSPAVNFVAGNPCRRPDQPQINSLGNDRIRLSWNAVPTATRYEVVYRNINGGTWNFETTTGTSYEITGLMANTRYEIQVRTVCNNLNISDFSTSVQATTSDANCNVPSGLSVSPGLNSLGLNWNSNGGNSWEVQYRVNNSQQAWITRTTSSSQITLNGLSASTEYLVRVRARCGNTFSAWTSPITVSTFLVRTGTSAATPALRVYPNPTEGMLTLEGIPTDGAQIVLLNLQGETLLTETAESAQPLQLDLGTLAPGVYFVQCIHGNVRQQLKVIKR